MFDTKLELSVKVSRQIIYEERSSLANEAFAVRTTRTPNARGSVYATYRNKRV